MRLLCRWFKALSEEPRLQILALILRNGPLCVCEVERFLEMTQSRASRHMRLLRDAGMLEDRRAGSCVYYHLADTEDPRLQRLLETVGFMLTNESVPDIADELSAMRLERAAPLVGID